MNKRNSIKLYIKAIILQLIVYILQQSKENLLQPLDLYGDDDVYLKKLQRKVLQNLFST
jgi:hypothetical protein